MKEFEGIDPTASKKIREWLEGPYDQETKDSIRSLLQKDPHALEDAFYANLSFGTGGLRGIMGIGTNRMNVYTVSMATQGLANYINNQPKNSCRRVLIGFDSRHQSDLFATYSSRILAANGIEVLLLKELRPTPYISFALRYCHCKSGIMITASHNPAEYNGYKVYWEDGAQVVYPYDEGIMKEVNSIQSMNQVKIVDINHPLIKRIDTELLDTAYLNAIRPLQLFEAENKKFGSQLKIAYTSLHGTGITLVPKALKDWGFDSLYLVKRQIIPDGDFPTVKFPNPEFKEALELGIQELLETQSDLLIATDPDADRMGIVVLHEKQPVILTGNEIAAICIDYLCKIMELRNILSEKAAFITTIVSTELISTIAMAFHRPCFKVLTGFKYIAELIHLWESSNNDYQFIFGAEESYGYLYGTHARDKDAIIASCLISEIALFYKLQRKTLVDCLHDIYHTHGIFREKQSSLNFQPGKEGMEKMKKLMEQVRKNHPASFGGKAVIAIEDYEIGIKQDKTTGKQTKLSLPQSDVLLYSLEGGNKLIIRPSGTEPKIKIYACSKETSFKTIEDGISLCEKSLDNLIKDAKTELS